MRVVEPEDGTGVGRAGSGALGNLPDVDMGGSGGHAAIFLVGAAGIVVVVGAFGVLLIENSVWMHAVGVGGVVSEEDLDGVAYFGAQDRPHEPEILFVGGTRLERAERTVGIFAIDRLFVDATDAMWSGFGVALLQLVKGLAHRFVATGRSVVPVQFVGGDVVGARLTGGCSRCGLRAGGRDEKEH